MVLNAGKTWCKNKDTFVLLIPSIYSISNCIGRSHKSHYITCRFVTGCVFLGGTESIGYCIVNTQFICLRSSVEYEIEKLYFSIELISLVFSLKFCLHKFWTTFVNILRFKDFATNYCLIANRKKNTVLNFKSMCGCRKNKDTVHWIKSGLNKS